MSIREPRWTLLVVAVLIILALANTIIKEVD